MYLFFSKDVSRKIHFSHKIVKKQMTTSYFHVIYYIFTHYTHNFLTKLLSANRIFEQQLVFSGASSIQVINLSSSPKRVSEAARIGYKSLCSTCVNYRTAFHAIDHQTFPNPFPGEADDISRSGKYSKHRTMPTYAA